jgi:hypothetical protein
MVTKFPHVTKITHVRSETTVECDNFQKVCNFCIIKIVLQFWNYGISLVGRDLRIRTRDLQQLRGWYALFKT